MIAASTYETFRERVLRPEQLADVARFYESRLFDEIPLYSRYGQIEPLVRDARSPDAAILNLALEYLEEVLACGRPTQSLFAAITLWEDEDSDYLVPNLLFCHGQVRQRLRHLRLHDPRTRFGKRICETLRPLDPHADFQVLEDTQTVPGRVRAFISRRRTTGRLLNLQRLKG